MPTRSSILAWKAPWKKEPSGLQSMGLQRVRQTRTHTHPFLSTLICYDSLIQPLQPRTFLMLPTECSFLKLNLVT